MMSRLDLYSRKVNLVPVYRVVGMAKKGHKRDQFRECFSELSEKWPEIRTKAESGVDTGEMWEQIVL